MRPRRRSLRKFTCALANDSIVTELQAEVTKDMEDSETTTEGTQPILLYSI